MSKMRPEIAGGTGKEGGKGRAGEEGGGAGGKGRGGEREMLSNLTSEGISTEAAVKANNEVIL